MRHVVLYKSFFRSMEYNYLRFRHDPTYRSVLEGRSRLVRAIREFFWQDDFIEVETPMLVRLPGMEPYLDVFQTRFVPEHAAERGAEYEAERGQDMYLITSPEYAMKKILVAGAPRIFQLTRSFRNKETGGALHNPEFTILEWYRAQSDYHGLMRDTEELVRYLVREFFGCDWFMYQGRRIEVGGVGAGDTWERLRVIEAFERYAKISRAVFEDPAALIAEARRRGYGGAGASGDSSGGDLSYDDAFFLIFLNEIEPHLGFERPTFLYDYPASMAALSRLTPGGAYAERVELYIAGIELANGFSELNDADEQERRLRAEYTERAQLGKTLYSVDERFLEALRVGMPDAAGIALGADRLLMLLLDRVGVDEVMWFPWRDL